MNFIMIGLLLREALDRLRVHLNMYLVWIETISILRQFLALLLSCDWLIVCLHVNC